MADGLGKLFKVPVKFNVLWVVTTHFSWFGMTTREKFSNFSFWVGYLCGIYFVVKGCCFTNLYFPVYKILSAKIFLKLKFLKNIT